MKSIVQKYSDLSGMLYKLCSKKERIRRQCLQLGRMECDLLNYLNQIEEPTCMNVLSDELKVSHSRITRIVDTLVDKKLVKRYFMILHKPDTQLTPGYMNGNHAP